MAALREVSCRIRLNTTFGDVLGCIPAKLVFELKTLEALRSGPNGEYELDCPRITIQVWFPDEKLVGLAYSSLMPKVAEAYGGITGNVHLGILTNCCSSHKIRGSLVYQDDPQLISLSVFNGYLADPPHLYSIPTVKGNKALRGLRMRVIVASAEERGLTFYDLPKTAENLDFEINPPLRYANADFAKLDSFSTTHINCRCLHE